VARDEVFEVFARIAPGDPMSHVGTLNAPHLDLARVYAWKIYDEEDWHEMWVVPRGAIASADPGHAHGLVTPDTSDGRPSGSPS
jgi:1,2-phenylacetyl-CoA epoxidase PaaB subunit